jgi:hypothetical protein
MYSLSPFAFSLSSIHSLSPFTFFSLSCIHSFPLYTFIIFNKLISSSLPLLNFLFPLTSLIPLSLTLLLIPPFFLFHCSYQIIELSFLLFFAFCSLLLTVINILSTLQKKFLLSNILLYSITCALLIFPLDGF